MFLFCQFYNIVVVVIIVVSGMQLLRLHSARHRQRPPQRAILSHVDCFRECEIVTSQIVLDGA